MGCFQMHSGASLVAVISILLLLLLGCQADVSSDVGPADVSSDVQQHQTRKLSNYSGYTRGRTSADDCLQGDVEVYQNDAPHLWSGIPAYSVEIINVCENCTVFDVHVSCRDFASTDLINPALFRRLGFDDCLVKDGGAMEPGEAISFEYSNSFAYPLRVSSVSCY